MLKRILASFGAFVGATAIAVCANLSTVSGPQDPSQLNATINTLVQSINTSVSRIGVGATQIVSTATTAEQTLYQYTLPAGFLVNAGDSVRVTCSGATSANANNKTLKLYFGSSVITTPTAATNNKGWLLQLTVMRTGATSQGIASWGLVDTTAVTPIATSGAETLANAITIKCTATQGTANAGDVTGQLFLVEAIK